MYTQVIKWPQIFHFLKVGGLRKCSTCNASFECDFCLAVVLILRLFLTALKIQVFDYLTKWI